MKIDFLPPDVATPLLTAFTASEIDALTAVFEEDGLFIGIGYEVEGHMYFHAEAGKALAVENLIAYLEEKDMIDQLRSNATMKDGETLTWEGRKNEETGF